MTHLAGVVALILAACTSLSSSAEIQITWTRDEVQQYGPTTPLSVSLGDLIRINCDQTRSIQLLTDILQYENCSCDAIPESCADNQLVAGTCTSGLRATVTIARTLLPSVFDYVPGQTYYFTSFASGGTSDGPCLPTEDGQPGLRMAITVEDPSATTTPEGIPTKIATDSMDKTDTASTKIEMTVDTTKGTESSVASSGRQAATVNQAAAIGGSVAGAIVVISVGSVCTVVIFLLLFLKSRSNKYVVGMTETRPLQNGDVEAGEVKKDKLKDGNGEVQGKRLSKPNDYQDFKYLKNPVVEVADADNDKIDLGSPEPHVFERSQGFAVSSGDFHFVAKTRMLSQNSSVSEAIPEENEVEASVREFSEPTDGQGKDEQRPPAPPTKLISIDENDVTANNLSPTESLVSTTGLMKKQESDLSFTTLAVKSIEAELQKQQDIPSKSDDDVFNTDVGQSSDERDKPKPLPVPRKMKPSTSSSSLNNILLDSKENSINPFTTLPRDNRPKVSEVESLFTTLPRGDMKPRPKPRVARKSESETKKNHAYEDIDAVVVKPKEMVKLDSDTNTAVKPKPRVARKSESEGKVQATASEQDANTSPTVKPRVARKSESEGKVQATDTKQDADTSPTVKPRVARNSESEGKVQATATGQHTDTGPTLKGEETTTSTTTTETSAPQSQTASESSNEQSDSRSSNDQSALTSSPDEKKD